LSAAAGLLEVLGEKAMADDFAHEARHLLTAVTETLTPANGRFENPAMPSSPRRRMDSAAVASLAATYPLQLMAADDPLVRNTCDYLFENCFIDGALFHDISHSGINPYLSLHVAQAMLRAGDTRYLRIMDRIRDLASPTGQWPEGIHPQTGYGCMGDGQHVWAAAEWAMMARNCFVREEQSSGVLVLCSGVAEEWLSPDVPIVFGPTQTAFGAISVTIAVEADRVLVGWKAAWHARPPIIKVSLPCAGKVTIVPPGQDRVALVRAKRS
jgi:hypothetical protein